MLKNFPLEVVVFFLHFHTHIHIGVAASSLPVRMASSVVSWVDAMDVVLSSLIAPRHQVKCLEGCGQGWGQGWGQGGGTSRALV